MDQMKFKTPMMQQYARIKKNYQDCILLFRLGDFYEMFLDDAKISSEILGITLTSRSRGTDGKIPMCGIPYHALDSYLGKLIRAGYKAAICEQMEDASQTKGMVRREVVRTVTPGTVLDDNNLIRKENNFLLAIEIGKRDLGLAYADLSTGEMYLRHLPIHNLEKDLAGEALRIQPTEIISSHQNYNRPEVLRTLRVTSSANIFPYDNWEINIRNYEKILKEHFGVTGFEGFGIKESENQTSLQAASVLLNYLKETQKSNLAHIKKLIPYHSGEYLKLDASTIANLELFSTLRGGIRRGTLIEILDATRTALGGRKLRRWLLQPLRDIKQINQRLSAVELLKTKISSRQKVQGLLSEVLDVERLLSRISVGTANPRDLIGLKHSLVQTLEIAACLSNELTELNYLFPAKLLENIKPLIALLTKELKPDPAATLIKGGYMADGISPELDKYRNVLFGSKKWLKEFETREKERTGISSMKVHQNMIHGFYIEVSKSNLDQIPPNYIRKQTLVNAERFIVPELKDREELAFEAEDKIKSLEQELFHELLTAILEFINPVQQIASQIAALDVFTSLAETAQKRRYTRPKLVEEGALIIKNGRHPVIEALQEEPFVPNDTWMKPDDSQILLITGPNMAGKSTYLRQTALVTLMSQMGSFVPAEEAQVPVRDQIFTRIGAVDNIGLGQSTFLVEMMETANILNNCTRESLIIFDEIGRGTSTFDGMSIAGAVVEYLAKNDQKAALTLFATHYHELTVLADKFPQIKNLQIAVEREKDSIVFLHKVIEGSAWQSYGVEVAKLAGLPKSVIARAQELLNRLKHQEKSLRSKKSSQVEGKTQTRLLG